MSILWTITLMSVVAGALLGMSVLATERARRHEQGAKEHAQKHEREALSQRDTARLNQYHAEIVSGQTDWRMANVGRLERRLMGHLPVDQQPDHRGWEWYYLLSLCHPEERTLYYRTWVPFAAWSPDGEYVGVGSTICNARSGEVLHRFSPSRIMRLQVAWSPDGKKYAWAMAGDDMNIYIWDSIADTVSTLHEDTSVHAIAWSPDAAQLASGGLIGTVKIWDVARGVTVQTLQNSVGVGDLVWSPNGHLLVAAIRGGGLRIWHMPDGKLVTEREEPKGGSIFKTRASWRPDSRQLAVCSEKGWYLLDRADWSVVREQDHPTGAGRDIAWNPAGTRLAVAHSDIVTLWDPAKEQPVATIRGHLHPVNSVAWSLDGRRLVTSDTEEEVKIWDLNVPVQPPPIHAGGPLESIRWLPNSHTLVAVSAADGATSHWDTAKGTRIRVEPPIAEGLQSPDRRLVALKSQSEVEPAIQVLDAQGVHSVWHAEPRQTLLEIAWSPDGSKLAIATKLDGDPAVEFWDVDREQRISRWTWRTVGGPNPRRMTWSPEGTRVAVVGKGDLGEKRGGSMGVASPSGRRLDRDTISQGPSG